jgi:hypothetical protein
MRTARSCLPSSTAAPTPTTTSRLGAADDPEDDDLTYVQVTYLACAQSPVWISRSISSELPGLTLHDDAHLGALWDRASQLAGDKYPINPLEAFVFGGAVLLRGLDKLKNTVEYRDAIAGLLRKETGVPATAHEIANPKKQIAEAALFAVLRRLHAQRAKVLATMDFRGQFLIDDTELRDNLGPLIGRVAASHHWNRLSLEEKLHPNVQGPPGFKPQEWEIDVLKVAHLPRCADATQIDQRRAPAFALAFHDPQGESLPHPGTP